MLRLRTLGAVDLRAADERTIDAVLAQPRRVALLTFLAAARPAGFHRRDRVVALFWPELDDGAARDALSGALRFLRNALGPDVVTTRSIDEVGVDPARLWCDAVAFREALDTAQTQEALRLYEGDFLDGFFADEAPGFEQWAESERAVLRSRAAQGARVLAEQTSERGLHTAAVAWGRREVELAPNDERAFRRLLGFLHRAGDRAGALRAYEEFARRLRADFGAEPATETQRLIADIRSGPRVDGVPAPANAPKPISPVRPTPLRGERKAHGEPLDVGAVVCNDRYVIQHRREESWSSTVYLATDVRHSRNVIVTVIRPEVVNAVGSAVLLHEIRAAAGLQHPHIVPVFDSGEISDEVFYVTPALGGESLSALLRRRPVIRTRSALRLARDIADALAAAHARERIHGDITADQVLVTGDPMTDDLHAMLADFAIARVLTAIGASFSPDVPDPLGNGNSASGFMAPDQVEGRGPDPRADVFAWGAVTRELLRACDDAPSSVAELVTQCRDPDPEVRPVDGRELVSRFDHAISLSRRAQPWGGKSIAAAAAGARSDNAIAGGARRTTRVIEAAVILLAVLMSRGRAPATYPQTVPVVVAAKDLPDGAELERSSVALAYWPRHAAPFAAYTVLDSVYGRTTIVAVAKGEVIVPNRLVGRGSQLRTPVETARGKLLYKTPIGNAGSSVGLIPRDSRVDVILVRNEGERNVQSVLIPDIRVLEIGQVSNHKTADGQVIVTAMATLEVTPADVDRIRAAVANGLIHLVPRATHSSRRPPTGRGS